MNRVFLEKSVSVYGKDFWGRQARISFHPAGAGQGWLWRINDAELIKLSHRNIERGTRQIQFCHSKKRLYAFEHLGILKWMGLLDVIIDSDPWYPYFGGRSLELLENVWPCCRLGNEVEWCTVLKKVRWDYPNPRAGRAAYIEIAPAQEKRIKLNITIAYPKIGERSISFTLADFNTLKGVSCAYTQGWPPYLFYLSEAASVILGWPHHSRITWPQRYEEKEVLDKFIAHRALDILGSLSLLCQDGLLAADVISVCCGHEGDLNVISKAAELICPLN
ncbi:hypothetical protein AMJ47_00055 [Parcubacteria bacterium DG_72]|nr:MAG: hypothetical protein AMJ47_00055 [Parcubacteria bacterium DG_72]